MAGRNFSLTPHLSDFIDDQVAGGRHQNASEVVREALRRYEEDILAERASLKAIEAVAARGLKDIAEGRYITVHGLADEQELLKRLRGRRKRAAKRA